MSFEDIDRDALPQGLARAVEALEKAQQHPATDPLWEYWGPLVVMVRLDEVKREAALWTGDLPKWAEMESRRVKRERHQAELINLRQSMEQRIREAEREADRLEREVKYYQTLANGLSEGVVQGIVAAMKAVECVRPGSEHGEKANYSPHPRIVQRVAWVSILCMENEIVQKAACEQVGVDPKTYRRHRDHPEVLAQIERLKVSKDARRVLENWREKGGSLGKNEWDFLDMSE